MFIDSDKLLVRLSSFHKEYWISQFDLLSAQRNSCYGGLGEVVLSPFEILTSFFVNTSNVRDTENLNFFAYKMIALPFSFLWYFKTIRIQLFAFMKRKMWNTQ